MCHIVKNVLETSYDHMTGFDKTGTKYFNQYKSRTLLNKPTKFDMTAPLSPCHTYKY